MPHNYTIISWYVLRSSGETYGKSQYMLWTDRRANVGCSTYVGTVTVEISRHDAARILWSARRGYYDERQQYVTVERNY